MKLPNSLRIAMMLCLPLCAHAHNDETMQTPASFQNKTPLSFMQNHGQVTDQDHHQRKDIGYKLSAPGMSVFIGKDGLHYQWSKTRKSPKLEHNVLQVPGMPEQDKETSYITDMYRLDVTLVGANAKATVEEEGQLEYTENYYLPQCPDGITTHTFGKIIYKNIYPGIDWVLYTSDGQFKYDFVVHAGADATNIKLRYDGSTSLDMKDGAVTAVTPFGNITENKPYSYVAETKGEVPSAFILKNNVLGFNIAKATHDIIIDPVLSWSTYYGGTDADIAYSISSSISSVCFAGTTTSTTNIATTGAHQTVYGGNPINSHGDGFVAKFNPSGAIQWATYYGGAGSEQLMKIITDANGNIYTGGTTTSTGLASAGAYRTSPAGVIFIKFNSSGVRQWATYYDGSGLGQYGIALNSSGDIYIAGTTSSTSLTVNGYQTSPGPGYIARFNSAGTWQWASYFYVGLSSVCLDATGNIYIGGNGTTPGSPSWVTAGAHQTTFGGGNDGIIAKLNATGSTRIWSTYYGGNANDAIGITCDAGGNVYAFGFANSTNNISTTGSHQASPGGGSDAFIAKFNTNGVRQWGTYYGGTGNDNVQGVDFGVDGNLYISGLTYSSTAIATTGSYQSVFGGIVDSYFASFSPNGVRKWGSYFGGSLGENVCLVDAHSGPIYLAGQTESLNNIATSGSYKTTNPGGSEAYLAQFDPDTNVYIVQPFTDTALCVGDTLNVDYGVTKSFNTSNVFRLQLSNSTGSFAAATTIATFTGNTGGSFLWIVPGTITSGSGYRIRVIASSPIDTGNEYPLDIKLAQYPTGPVAGSNSPICSGNTLNITANSSSGVTYSWTGPASFTSSAQNPSIPSVTTAATGSYIVTASLFGCSAKDTVAVTVNQTPLKPTAGSNSPLCVGQTLNLTATSGTTGVNWSWAGPAFSSSVQNPTLLSVGTTNAGDYIVTASIGNCSTKDTVAVIVNPGPGINIYPSPKDTICAGASVTLVAVTINGGSGATFQWFKNGVAISGAVAQSYKASSPASGDVFYCQLTTSGTSCVGAINSNLITIIVLPYTTPSVNIVASPDTNIWQGLQVTFTAAPGNCSKPTYQWKLNNQNVNGATANTWSAVTLSNNDIVSCVITCNDVCPQPKDAVSNSLTIHVATSIGDINRITDINLYPNPNNGNFVLQVPGLQEDASVTILNSIGQTLCQKNITSAGKNIRAEISLGTISDGVYLMVFKTKDGIITKRFTVSH